MDVQIDLTAITVVSVTFFTAALIVATVFHFRHRAKELTHQTVRLALEKGQPLPAGLLGEAARPPANDRDLRRGVLLLFTGAGLSLFFALVEPRHWPVGLIPAFVGLGFLAAHALTARGAARIPATD